MRKSPSARLLDLLAGWSAFVDSDEQHSIYDAGLSSEAIGELYQLAGAQSIAWDELSRSEADAAITEFVLEQILPLVLTSTAQSQPRPQSSSIAEADRDAPTSLAAVSEGMVIGRGK